MRGNEAFGTIFSILSWLNATWIGVETFSEIKINSGLSPWIEFPPSCDSSLLVSAPCQAMVKLLGPGRMMIQFVWFRLSPPNHSTHSCMRRTCVYPHADTSHSTRVYCLLSYLSAAHETISLNWFPLHLHILCARWQGRIHFNETETAILLQTTVCALEFIFDLGVTVTTWLSTDRQFIFSGICLSLPSQPHL